MTHKLKFASLRALAKSALRLLACCLALMVWLLTAGMARAQSGRTFYIDFSSGSNSNVGSKASPWKSHPFMQTGSACSGTGSAPTYTHQAGDQFIFKGGVTWPVACFQMSIPAGGNSSATDYYGVDKTWFTGGSFARPLFDMGGSVPTGQHVITVTSAFPGYTTFDTIEIANQGLTLGTVNQDDAYNFTAVGTAPIPSVLIENGYIHDWVSNTNVAAFTVSQTIPYPSGAIDDGHDRITVDHMTIEDSAGFVFAGATKISGGFGGACGNCGTYSNSTTHDTFAGCFTVASCHDSEFYNVSQKIADYCGDASGRGGGACRPHSQVIEDDIPVGSDGGGWMKVYNNLIHDNPAGVTIYVPYNSHIYNNVMWNNANSSILLQHIAGDSSSASGEVYNNTIDCSNGNHCVATDSKPGNILGTLFLKNNQFISNGSSITCFSPTGTCATIAVVTQSNNVTTTTTQAAGKYTPSTKYFANTCSGAGCPIGQGANLTASSTGNLSNLSHDASGAPWFGGSYKARPTGSTAWDSGAYLSQGGSTGPPSISISAPTNGATVSGSISLISSCTPQGSATVSSIQYQIDGDTFGAPGTASPYPLSWNTLTTANGSHTIAAVCTDSNGQTATSAAVNVTASNSMPGCFVSGSNTNWNAFQAFTAQTGTFVSTFTATPNTADQDSVIGYSQAPASAYGDMAALVRFNNTGHIDVYQGSLGNYTADTSVSYTADVTYAFTLTVNISAGTYTVALTSPSSVTLATNYSFRTTALTASLGYINAVSDNTTPDTAQVCNFQIGSTASLTFSPAAVSSGNITVGSNATQTIATTASGGPANFSSVAITGSADFTINSNTCTGSVPSSCATQIQFAPTSAALETATVTYTDDATGSPQTVAVSGTGVPATPTLSVSPATMNFSDVLIHTTSSSGPIVLTIASGPATFTGTPSLSGTNAADFALASNTCAGSVSAASCQTVVSFTPSLVAAESATLTYTDNATGSPQSVPLTGTGYLAPHPPTNVSATVE